MLPLMEPKSPCAALAAKLFEAFKRLEEDPTFKRHLQALYAVRKKFPPRIHVNKFATGGAVEELLTRMIQHCGMNCVNVSSTGILIDIRIKNDDEEEFPFSIKSIQKMGSQIILQNYHGKKHAIEQLPPTILVVIEPTKLTFAYMDEEIIQRTGIPADVIYAHKDSNLSMRGKFVSTLLKEHLADDLLLEMTAPEIPPVKEEDLTIVIVERVLSELP
jgi:hypothetical protein